jgi:NAD(P)-dependent dehydrogenase (short-subunit alcohol dehydrogenase family)
MLNGYNVMITGATSGIGLSTAKEFLAQGATVIGMGRNLDKLPDLGDKFIPLRCDVEKPEEIEAAVAFADKTFNGKLDSLVLNAGAALPGTVEEATYETMDRSNNILVRANMIFVKLCVPLLRKSENPSVSITASMAVFIMGTEFTYYVGKSAVASYCRQAAGALKGIRVNAICPGLIETPILPDEVWVAAKAAHSHRIPSRRVGRPEECAKLLSFLSSKRARYITGSIIPIDGGFSLEHPRAMPYI